MFANLLEFPIVQALISTVLIGVVPAILLVFISVDEMKQNMGYLQVLIAFASGGILADVFVNLLPEIAVIAQTSSMNLSYVLLIGLYTFFTLEILLNFFIKDDDDVEEEQVESHADEEDSTVRRRNHDIKKPPNNKKKKLKMNSKGYLSLIADFVHNITDGLLIGSSFLHSTPLGISTSISIMCHEIPNEIGDFISLINANCSKKKAIAFQFLTAIGSILGTLLAFTLGNMSSQVGDALMPFSTGGFIYIGTVSMLGQISQKNCGGIIHMFKMLLAAFLGISFLVLANKI